MASVCTGSPVYAAAGLLSGRPAATHWASIERLASLDATIEVRACDWSLTPATWWPPPASRRVSTWSSTWSTDLPAQSGPARSERASSRTPSHVSERSYLTCCSVAARLHETPGIIDADRFRNVGKTRETRLTQLSRHGIAVLGATRQVPISFTKADAEGAAERRFCVLPRGTYRVLEARYALVRPMWASLRLALPGLWAGYALGWDLSGAADEEVFALVEERCEPGNKPGTFRTHRQREGHRERGEE